jgi:hypothetical protein
MRPVRIWWHGREWLMRRLQGQATRALVGRGPSADGGRPHEEILRGLAGQIKRTGEQSHAGFRRLVGLPRMWRAGNPAGFAAGGVAAVTSRRAAATLSGTCYTSVQPVADAR